MTKTYRNVIVMTAFVLVFTAPRFFENQLANNDKGGFEMNAFVKDPVYTVLYRIILFFIFMYLMPIVLLSVFNVGLLVALHKATSAREELLGQQQTSSDSASSKRSPRRTKPSATSTLSASRSVTAIVIIVCIVCIVTNLCAMLSHLLWSLHTTFKDLAEVEILRRYVTHVSNLCITINSSVNFVIYYTCSSNFRAEFSRTVFCSTSSNANSRKISSTSVTAMTSLQKSRGYWIASMNEHSLNNIK